MLLWFCYPDAGIVDFETTWQNTPAAARHNKVNTSRLFGEFLVAFLNLRKVPALLFVEARMTEATGTPLSMP
ncbi:hypothetical protein CHU98_g11323 [Xylaria longipes]|nr:hypothetical protein CHU98_g11323 [Xylaria longipes]